MRGRVILAMAVVLNAAMVLAQEPAAGLTLTELMQALQYAELVRAPALTREQLAALADIQSRWSDVQRVPGPVADAFHEVCLQVLRGTSTDEAMAGLGPLGQELGQAQQQVQQASQELATELAQTLSAEQRRALVAFLSPVRGLSGLVGALRQVRKAPPQAWEQMRPHMVGALRGFAGSQTTAAVPEQTIVGMLDRARQMPDAEFEKAAPGLPEEWAKALAPEVVRQVDDPAWQEQRLQEVCHRLIADPAGRDLVARILAEQREAPPPPAPAAPGAAAPPAANP